MNYSSDHIPAPISCVPEARFNLLHVLCLYSVSFLFFFWNKKEVGGAFQLSHTVVVLKGENAFLQMGFVFIAFDFRYHSILFHVCEI